MTGVTENVGFFFQAPFSTLYHYTVCCQPQEETWLIVVLFIGNFPPPMCFQPIWLILFLNQQPTNENKMGVAVPTFNDMFP